MRTCRCSLAAGPNKQDLAHQRAGLTVQNPSTVGAADAAAHNALESGDGLAGPPRRLAAADVSLEGGEILSIEKRAGRNQGVQATSPVASAGTLYSWGLKEWRLGRMNGEQSVPSPALPEVKVISIAASRHSAIATAEVRGLSYAAAIHV